VRHALLLALTLLYLLPAGVLVAGSLRPDEPGPARLSAENYRQVFERAPFWRYLGNTLLIAGGIVVGGLAVNSALGFALARLRWRGRLLALTAVLALLALPFEAVAIPLFYGVSVTGWRDTYLVQILPFLAQPLSVYLFYSFFVGFPKELEEAARVDGAGPVRIWLQILVPNSGPALGAVTVTSFLSAWGAFLWPLLVTSGAQVRPLPLALATFKTQPPIAWGDIYAFAVLAALPVAGVFWLLEPWFVRSLATTGLKG